MEHLRKVGQRYTARYGDALPAAGLPSEDKDDDAASAGGSVEGHDEPQAAAAEAAQSQGPDPPPEAHHAAEALAHLEDGTADDGDAGPHDFDFGSDVDHASPDG